jgi:hypothetical protein
MAFLRKKLKAVFFYDERGCVPTYEESDGTCYDVPETETAEELKAVIEESMKRDIDLVAEHYKDYNVNSSTPTGCKYTNKVFRRRCGIARNVDLGETL